ncbi:MAG: cobalt-precorrin-5B (C(1))-methyltransferase CbiD [Verrucomicrobia bacterium]|nr:cobalt-precorrin-5B (C(1))-methyltransferase CbiD [Verrucomicrobiota bacterium]
MTGLRTGYTTGACAAAAAKAAATLLCRSTAPAEVEILLPDQSRATFPVLNCHNVGDACEASVRKHAGDDPDVTDKACIIATVAFVDGNEVIFAAGEGVGTVTKPGLSVPPGEPAINPAPRQMIRNAIREITDRGMRVTISVPDGRELAARTFNPRLGVVGGISIIGTSGRVRPFSSAALRDALKCSLDVAAANGVRSPVLVPGNIGERAARKNFRLSAEQVVQVSNQWGFMLEQFAKCDFPCLMVLGHPGKLAKLVEGHWDTHSSQSPNAVPIVARLAEAALSRRLPESTTVEGIFESLSAEEQRKLAGALAAKIRSSIAERLGSQREIAVVLINLTGNILGHNGDLKPWT